MKKQRRTLCLTLDYELYGDGSGDVYIHMIRPTEKIIEICERYNIKLTLFFEIVEYSKLKEVRDRGGLIGYDSDPVAAIEEQIYSLAGLGHDIQLHIHPQWVNAVYNDGLWSVDFNNWRLGGFNGGINYGAKELIRDSKNMLENLMRHRYPEYTCRVLRAGGYNIMPCDQVYQGMVENGLVADSSVYPGGYEDGPLSKYDYREAPVDSDYWLADPANFSRPSGQSMVTEIPIFSMAMPGYSILTLERVRSLAKQKIYGMRSKAAQYAKPVRKEKTRMLSTLFARRATTWDFCLFSKRMHMHFFRAIDKYYKQRQLFLLVGHPKGFSSAKSFEWFVRYALSEGYDFKTLKEVVVHA